jgi:hypothetical protein
MKVKASLSFETSVNTVQLGYNVLKGTKYFVSLQTSVVITKEYYKNEELIGTTEYLTL